MGITFIIVLFETVEDVRKLLDIETKVIILGL
jgi:hypothetical protein